MKKRLQKKLHKGKFQEKGFYIDFEYNSNLSEKELDAYWEKFIEEAIEGNNLCVGGGGDYKQTYFVCKQKGSANLNDIEKLRKWFVAQKENIVSYSIGNLKDAWY